MPEIVAVFVSKFDSSEACCICFRFIRDNQKFCRSESQIAHLRCARRKHWTRAKRIKKPVEVEKVKRKIKVIRDGQVVKEIG